jgi:glycosyltransferase involved in cell wall biosynthesis
MKILHLIASVNPTHGGPIESVLQGALAWARLGHETQIACLDHPSDPWVKACPIAVHALGLGGETYDGFRKCLPWLRYGYSPRLVPWLKANRGGYDAFVVNGLWNYVAFAAKRAFSGGKAPYLVFSHGMLDPWFKKAYPLKHIAKQIVWLFSEGPLLTGAASVIFTTEDERRLARNAFWPYRITERVLDFGTADPPAASIQQIEAFRAAFPRLRGRRYLLFLSRIHPKKGIDLLIRAFASKARSVADLDLVIAGPDQVGYRAQLEGIARESGVGDRVVWPGMIQGDLKWGMIRSAEALILPSHQENFGIVVAEAMACGRPVLISDKVNVCGEVEASKSGIVAADDLAGTETLLDRFLALSDDAKAKMGAAGRQCFLEKFEIGRSAVSLLDLIAELRG